MTQTLVERIAENVYKRQRPDRWHVDPAQAAEPHLHLGASGLPRYAVDRLAVRINGRRGGADRPWITHESVELLDRMLRPSDVGLEYGSGGSTMWFARRVRSLISVEAFDAWHARTRERLDTAGIRNVDLRLVSAERLGYETEEHRAAYLGVATGLASASLDFVFVDAEYRDDAALGAVDLVKPGGLLIIDNINTYLPNPYRSPWKVDRPATATWARFADAVAGWRQVWTTNGVWDTAFWVKP